MHSLDAGDDSRANPRRRIVAGHARGADAHSNLAAANSATRADLPRRTLRLEVASRLRELSLLLDAGRVQAMALSAALATAERADPSGAELEERSRELVLRATRAALVEDSTAELANAPAIDCADRYEFLSREYGIDPSSARSRAVRFNALPPRTRKVYFELLVHRRPAAALARELACSRASLGASLRAALDVLYADSPR